MGHLTLIYDGSCGFCTKLVRLLAGLDRRNRITAVPCSDRERVYGLGISQQQCMESAWAVEETGLKLRGADAVLFSLASALGVPWTRFLWRLPGINWLLERGYRFIAGRRHCLQCRD